jgi:hypothetical protein
MAVHPYVGPWPFFSFFILYTVGRTPSKGDQPVARPLPTHRTTQKRINAHNTDIHALSGIRTHDPSVRASEDSSCLSPRCHRDQPENKLVFIICSVDGRDEKGIQMEVRDKLHVSAALPSRKEPPAPIE